MTGAEVPGYRAEKGVNPQSTTETFVACGCNLDSWRWAGVPFYLRTGKRLPKRTTEIAIQFRRPPLQIFRRVEPDVGRAEPAHRQRAAGRRDLACDSRRSCPGTRMQLAPVMMNFRYGTAFGGAVPEAYETLLLDAMLGDPTLFARHDFVESVVGADHARPRGVARGGRGGDSDLRSGRVGTARGRRSDGARRPALEEL